MAIFDRKVGDKPIEDCHIAIAPRNDVLGGNINIKNPDSLGYPDFLFKVK